MVSSSVVNSNTKAVGTMAPHSSVNHQASPRVPGDAHSTCTVREKLFRDDEDDDLYISRGESREERDDARGGANDVDGDDEEKEEREDAIVIDSMRPRRPLPTTRSGSRMVITSSML